MNATVSHVIIQDHEKMLMSNTRTEGNSFGISVLIATMAG